MGGSLFKNTYSTAQKILFVTIAAVIYIAAFFLVYPHVGTLAAGLGLLPVIAAGILCGRRGTIISTTGVFFIGLLLMRLNHFDFSSPEANLKILIGNLFILISALVIGWSSSLMRQVQRQNSALDEERARLKDEIIKRKESEVRLRKQQEFSNTLQQGLALLSSNPGQSFVLDNILQLIKNGIECDNVSLLLSENDSLVVHANNGHTGSIQITGIRFPITENSQNPGVRVFLDKKPIIIEDVNNHPGWINIRGLSEVMSWLSAPLLLNGQSIGIIGMERSSTNPFTPTDLLLVQAFAKSIALVIENVRLYQQAQQEIEERKRTSEKLQRRLQTEALISSFSAHLLNADLSNIEHDLQEILGQLGRFTEAESCYFSLLGADKFTFLDDFTWTNGEVLPRKDNEQISDIRNLPWVYQQLSSFETIYIPDIEDLGSDAALEKDRWQKLGIHSLLLIPIVRNEVLLGILGFNTESKRANWAQEDIISLQLVANIFSSFWAGRKAEIDQKEKLFFVEGLVDAIPTPIFYIDNKGVYLGCNKALAKSYGVKKDELIGKTAYDFLKKELADHYMSVDMQIMENGKPSVNQELSTYADGTNHILVAHKAPFFDIEGNAMGLIAVMLDVTELKEMEYALEKERSSLAEKVHQQTAELRTANKELAHAAKAKDEFLAAMSHELRTPLNAILGLSEALQEQVYGPVNHKQEKTLSHIQDSGAHLLALISDILDLAKIGADRMDLDTAPVDANFICETTLTMLHEIAQDKNLSLDLKLDPQVKIIHADGRRLKQILLNLLSNAIKFTPDGGGVSLEMEGDPRASLVRFHIRDTGIGISKEDLPTIFTPFQQIDSSLSRKYEGAGLGLALAAQMVSLHRGTISVESEPNKGSHFCVSLPWAPTIKNTNPGERNTVPLNRLSSSQETTPANSLIMIAEDNLANQETMADYLIAKGYRVVNAVNGSLALKIAKQSRPDLILMDIQMPEMDGFEATLLIRKEPDLANIPIIAITALAMPGDKEKCLAAGVNDYLVKPVQLTTLIETIQYQLAQN
jgi:PAS domain S-box-containing protein